MCRHVRVSGVVMLLLVCGKVDAGRPFEVPLRINFGGAETTDSLGRTWLGDGAGSGDPLAIRPDDAGGSNWWEDFSIGAFQPDSLDALGFDSTDPGDVYIFNSIRWDDAAVPPDFRLEFPLPAGTYTVNLYFNEGWTADRHFKIEMQGTIVDDDVSYLDYDPITPALGRVGVLSFPGTVVGADNLLRVGLLPCPGCPGAVDVNPFLDALEVISAPQCGTLGMDFNCTYDPEADQIVMTWNGTEGADGYRILRNGQSMGAPLGSDARSFSDPSPRQGGSSPTYVVQALDGDVSFQECRCTVTAFACPGDLACAVNPTSNEVTLTWTAGFAVDVTGYEVRRNGLLVQSLPGSATNFSDDPGTRIVTYTVTPIQSTQGQCAPMSCRASLDIPFEIPLRINVGGAETVDSKGRVWFGDGPGAGDPLGIRPNDAGGANWIESWCPASADTLLKLGFTPGSAADSYILTTLRWDQSNDAANFDLELPVPNHEGYFVNLYFNECLRTQRHFKISIQGQIVDEDVSYADYATPPAFGKVGRLTFKDILVEDGVLRISLLPCPTCPSVDDTNPILNAIEVIEDPCADPGFRVCPANITGRFNALASRAQISWDLPVCLPLTGYEVRRNGELVATLPPDAAGYFETLSQRVAFYEVRVLVPQGTDPCPMLTCTVVNSKVPFEVPLRLNMGGPFVTDSLGNRWLGDVLADRDALDIRVDDAGGNQVAFSPCVPAAISNDDSLAALGHDPFSTADQSIFNSLRWDVADDGLIGDPSDDVDFRLEVPVPDGSYIVNMYFTECWALDRHFQILIEDQVIEDDVNPAQDLGMIHAGRTGRLSFGGISVGDGALSLALLPCFDCPFDPLIGLDPNPMVSAIEVLPAGTEVSTCPRGLVCQDDAGGGVAGSWTGPENVAITGYDLYRNGEKIASLPASATTFEDTPTCERVTLYEVVPISGAALPCPGLRLRCVHIQPGCDFVAPVRVNMGGLDVVDSKGDLWLGDGPSFGDRLEIRPDDAGGTNWIENWSLVWFQPDSLGALGFDPENLADVYVFNTIRWDAGSDDTDFRLEFPLEDGTYDVGLYFNEGSTPRRHFKVELQGAVVVEDLTTEELGVVRELRYAGVEVSDGLLRLGFLPCRECPGVSDINPFIDAVQITASGTEGPRFHRGDANGDGTLNITDGIFVLNYLFLGGPAPGCQEAANANDDPALNITDGIFILNYLFLGGPGPAAPGPPGAADPCGPDPANSQSALGCAEYTGC